MIESDTQWDWFLRLSAGGRGWRAIYRVQPTFTICSLRENTRESLTSEFWNSPTLKFPEFSALDPNPDSATEHIRDSDEKCLPKSPENFVSAVLWTIDNECYQALVYLLDKSDHEQLSETNSGSNLLLLALETYRGRLGHESDILTSEMFGILSKLISGAMKMNRLDHGDKYGCSPLTWSLGYQNYNLVERLIVLSSNKILGCGDFNEYSSVVENITHTVGILLKHGADPNVLCANGLSPLIIFFSIPSQYGQIDANPAFGTPPHYGQDLGWTKLLCHRSLKSSGESTNASLGRREVQVSGYMGKPSGRWVPSSLVGRCITWT